MIKRRCDARGARAEAWPMSRRETRANFLARLKRTAKNLPPSFVLGCFKNMKVRCVRLGAAEGGLFEEGGR